MNNVENGINYSDNRNRKIMHQPKAVKGTSSNNLLDSGDKPAIESNLSKIEPSRKF